MRGSNLIMRSSQEENAECVGCIRDSEYPRCLPSQRRFRFGVATPSINTPYKLNEINPAGAYLYAFLTAGLIPETRYAKYPSSPTR